MNDLFRHLVCGALAAMFATPMALAQTVATIAPPNAIETYPMGVHGKAIVGSYVDRNVGGILGFSLSPQGTYSVFAAPEADPNTGTVAVGIDDAGIVSGYFQDVRGIQHGFVRFVNEQVVTIDVPGGPFPDFRNTGFVAVNGDGTGIGYYVDYQYIYGGFARTPGGAIILINVPGSTQSFPKAINSKGEIVGLFVDGNGQIHAFLRSRRGIFSSFDAPSGSSFYWYSSIGIDDDGDVATSYYDAQGKFHGYQRSRRGRVTLIDVPGARDTIPIGVSETGVVAGEFIDASYNIHGFTWSKRHNFTLFDFPGAPSPFGAVIAVGDEGVIIGTYEKLYAPVQGFARYPKQTERDDTDD